MPQLRMPYILSPKVVIDSEAMWFEGSAYEKEKIYRIEKDKMPPVNYDLHRLKPHSLTHAEGSLHVTSDGQPIDQYFNRPEHFYGNCLVIKLPGNKYKLVDETKKIYHWEVSLDDLVSSIERVLNKTADFGPDKIIVTTDFYPLNQHGFHDPNYVLTLSKLAAEYLVKNENFNMYGTSWKSSDYMPGSKERPIHKTLFKRAIIFELLDLKNVPEGEYFFVGFPLRLEGASESPVTPVLFSKNEIY